MLLSIPMAAAYPLLHPLGIPRQIVINNQGTKLDIDTFDSCFGGNHNTGLITKMLNQCGANIDVSGASDTACALVGSQPVFIYGRGFSAVVGAAELNNLARIAVDLQVLIKVSLSAT